MGNPKRPGSGIMKIMSPPQLPTEDLPDEISYRTPQNVTGVVAPPEPEVDPTAVPTGTARKVLEWVGSDKDRAQQALDLEEERETPRKGLSEHLRMIIGSDDESDEDE